LRSRPRNQFFFNVSGDFKLALFDAFKLLSKPFVFTPHHVTDDIKQNVNALLRQLA